MPEDASENSNKDNPKAEKAIPPKPENPEPKETLNKDDSKKEGEGDKEKSNQAADQPKKEEEKPIEEKLKPESLSDEMKNALTKQVKDEESEAEILFADRKTEEEHYTIWNLDLWLESCLKGYNPILGFLMEVFIICFIFIIPSSYFLYSNGGKIDLKKYFSSPGGLDMSNESVFRLSLFIVTCYIFDSATWLISKNIVSLFSAVLSLLWLDESEFFWTVVDGFNSSKEYLRLCAVFLFVFYISNKMFSKFNYPEMKDLISLETNAIKGLVLWYGIYMGMTFIMEIIVYFFICDLKRSSYADAICRLNQKLFIFKKLKLISESGADRSYVCENMVIGFDPGFYLTDNGFFISKDDSEVVAQNIMALLKIKYFTYDQIKKYFPKDHESVFKYLSKSDEVHQEQKISVKTFKGLAKELYSKREDMSRTIAARNYIFEQLELIFSIIVKYISAMVWCTIFTLDYKIYVAGFGTSILTFSWIFGDSIKKLFNCFVFILVIRPYDIGDKINLSGEAYTVRRINLLTTTFLTSLKKLLYVPNHVLMNERIHNMSRSPSERLKLEILLSSGDTTFEKAVSLEKKLKDEIEKKKKYFSDVNFQQILNDKLYFVIHTKQNFHDSEETQEIKRRIIQLFTDNLKKEGISHKNHFLFTD